MNEKQYEVIKYTNGKTYNFDIYDFFYDSQNALIIYDEHGERKKAYDADLLKCNSEMAVYRIEKGTIIITKKKNN